MNFYLHAELIILAIAFFGIITYFVKKSTLQIKQALVWYLASVVFILMAFFPKCIMVVASWFNIKTPVNSVFLVVIAFLIIIVFLNNITISKQQEEIKLLLQEMSILKSGAETTTDENNGI